MRLCERKVDKHHLEYKGNILSLLLIIIIVIIIVIIIIITIIIAIIVISPEIKDCTGKSPISECFKWFQWKNKLHMEDFPAMCDYRRVNRHT